jgi:hypothetical protein
MSDAYMVAPGTGEVVAQGAFGFVQEKIVDSEEFVKIYLAGIRRYGELSKAGALLFEFVYREISGRAGKDRDTVLLNYVLAVEWNNTLSRRTYERGMSELTRKGLSFPLDGGGYVLRERPLHVQRQSHGPGGKLPAQRDRPPKRNYPLTPPPLCPRQTTNRRLRLLTKSVNNEIVKFVLSSNRL